MHSHFRHASDIDDIAGHSNARSLAREYVKPARNYICRLVTEWVSPCRSNVTLHPFSSINCTMCLFKFHPSEVNNHTHSGLDSWMLFLYGYSTRTLIFHATWYFPLDNNCDPIQMIASTRVDQGPQRPWSSDATTVTYGDDEYNPLAFFLAFLPARTITWSTTYLPGINGPPTASGDQWSTS